MKIKKESPSLKFLYRSVRPFSERLKENNSTTFICIKYVKINNNFLRSKRFVGWKERRLRDRGH